MAHPDIKNESWQRDYIGKSHPDRRSSTESLEAGTTPEADRRRLIVIAGPSCVGKSSLLKRVSRDDIPLWLAFLPYDIERPFEIRNAWEWNDGVGPALAAQTVFLHYDLFRLLGLASVHYTDDPALTQIEEFAAVNCITLWEPVPILRRRARQRCRQIFAELIQTHDHARFKQRIARRRRMTPYYQYARLEQVYFQWRNFCQTWSHVDFHLFQPSTNQWLNS